MVVGPWQALLGGRAGMSRDCGSVSFWAGFSLMRWTWVALPCMVPFWTGTLLSRWAWWCAVGAFAVRASVVPASCDMGVAEWWVWVGPSRRSTGVVRMWYGGVLEGRVWGDCVWCWLVTGRVDVGLWLWSGWLTWLWDWCRPGGLGVVMLIGETVSVKWWDRAVVSCDWWVKSAKVVGPC